MVFKDVVVKCAGVQTAPQKNVTNIASSGILWPGGRIRQPEPLLRQPGPLLHDCCRHSLINSQQSVDLQLAVGLLVCCGCKVLWPAGFRRQLTP
jgi:hypothetical protein